MSDTEFPKNPSDTNQEQVNEASETTDALYAVPESDDEKFEELLKEPQQRNRKYYTHAEYYQLTKEKEMEKLAQEIEEKEGRNTKKKKRNWWIKTVLMLALIALSIFLMFTINDYIAVDGAKPFQEMIKGIDWRFFVLFIGVVLAYMFFEGCKFSYLLKISTGKFRFKTSLKTMYLGRYYDGITPLASGGQPFQIYYLHKKDISAGVATSVPLVQFIVMTFVACFTGIVLLAIGPIFVEFTPANYWLVILSWVSLSCNLLVPVTIIFVSLFPRLGRKIIAFIVSILSKIRIVKRKYPIMKKYIVEIDEYRDALKLLIRRWWKLIPLILISMVSFGIYLSIPFCAVLTIAGPSVTDNLLLLYMQTVCLSMVTYFSVALIPTPGNSGASEASSALVFTTIANVSSITSWMVLLSRFATYYVFILSGIGINIFEIIRSAVRNKRAARLEQKSAEKSQAETTENQEHPCNEAITPDNQSTNKEE